MKPQLLGSALVAAILSLTGVPLAYAQPQADHAELVKEEARELYRKGRARFESGQFAEARAAFATAWGVEKHWSIALGLADCELELKRHRDAAEHLDIALKGMPKDYPRRSATEKALAESATKVAVVEVTVSVDGAEVSVDGNVVGKYPLLQRLYLDPGRHTLQAKIPSAPPANITLDVTAGGSYPVLLELASESHSSPPPLKATAKPATASPPEGEEKADTAWSGRTIAVWSGLGATAVAAGVGLVYTLKASSASSDADGLQDRVTANLGADGCAGAPHPLCDELEQKFDDRDSARGTANGAWIASGVLLGATAGAYFLWPKSDSLKTNLSWSPVVLPNGAAFSLTGELP